MTHDAETVLKPCPFCGGNAYLSNVAMAGCSYVVCTDCRMQTDDGAQKRVVEKWNTRAAMQPTVQEAAKVLIAADDLANAVGFMNEVGGQTATSQLMMCLNKFRALAGEDKA